MSSIPQRGEDKSYRTLVDLKGFIIYSLNIWSASNSATGFIKICQFWRAPFHSTLKINTRPPSQRGCQSQAVRLHIWELAVIVDSPNLSELWNPVAIWVMESSGINYQECVFFRWQSMCPTSPLEIQHCHKDLASTWSKRPQKALTTPLGSCQLQKSQVDRKPLRGSSSLPLWNLTKMVLNMVSWFQFKT